MLRYIYALKENYMGNYMSYVSLEQYRADGNANMITKRAYDAYGEACSVISSFIPCLLT